VLFIIFSFHIASAAAIDLGEPAHLTEVKCGELGIACPDSEEESRNALLATLASRVNALIFFAGIIIVLAILYGSIKYITSTGDEAEAKKAKQIIVYAIIGLLVIGISGIAINAYINILSGANPIINPFGWIGWL
jgi:hypothetical protein